MATNSRFAIAVHTAAMLAFHGGEPVTSDEIACSVRTNPVIIRRILQLLTKAGIVRSQLGKRGGSRLVHSPKRTTLWDIYRAVEKDGVFGFSERPGNPECPISCCMQAGLRSVFDMTQHALTETLQGITIEELIKSVPARTSRNTNK